jgi:hypothetical protein
VLRGQGCDYLSDNISGFDNTVNIAKQAGVVLVNLQAGELYNSISVISLFSRRKDDGTL